MLSIDRACASTKSLDTFGSVLLGFIVAVRCPSVCLFVCSVHPNMIAHSCRLFPQCTRFRGNPFSVTAGRHACMRQRYILLLRNEREFLGKQPYVIDAKSWILACSSARLSAHARRRGFRVTLGYACPLLRIVPNCSALVAREQTLRCGLCAS
jgi:hypothetical protein